MKDNTIHSYGLICYRPSLNPNNVGKLEYLLVQRKHSISYIEFLRGKYNMKANNSLTYINYLLFTMTNEERENLLFKPFTELWKDLWMYRDEPKSKNGFSTSEKHQNEFVIAEDKFEKIKKGKYFEIAPGKKKLFNLKDLLERPGRENCSLEWGFPKGRKDKGEMPLNTAIREFVEETNYRPSDIEIFSEFLPMEERFLGSNNQTYQYNYYIARLAQDESKHGGTINPNNYSQITEIGNIGWFTLEKANKKIGSQYLERLGLLEKLNVLLEEQFRMEDYRLLGTKG